MTITAHIAGIPVEETLLAFAPLGVAGVGALLAAVVQRMRRTPWSRKAGRARTRPDSPRARPEPRP